MKQTGGLKRSPTDTINSYITDMLALEEHIEKAVSGQIQALGDHPQVGADLRTYVTGSTSISRTWSS